MNEVMGVGGGHKNEKEDAMKNSLTCGCSEAATETPEAVAEIAVGVLLSPAMMSSSGVSLC